MTQPVTLDPSEIPGKHLVEGQDMINMAAAINGIATMTSAGTYYLTPTQSTSSNTLGTTTYAILATATATGSAITSGNLRAIRGIANFQGTTTTGGGAYIWGIQGKFVPSAAAVMNNANDRMGALFGQMDLSASPTMTTGQVSVGWFDWGATATGTVGGQANTIRLQNTTAATPNAHIYAYGKASFFYDVYANGGGWTYTTGAASTEAGGLKVQVEGNTRYLQLYSSAGTLA